MKTVTIVYGFDNADQIEKAILSISSIRLQPKIEINILIFVSSVNLKTKVEKELKFLELQFDINILLCDFLKPIMRRGMYFWLYSPFFSKSDFLLQLDNDTLLNCNINKMIKSIRFKKKTIFAVKIVFSKDKKVVKNITTLINSKYNLRLSAENISNNWINSGVVLINRRLYLEKFPTIDQLNFEIISYNNLKEHNNIRETHFSDEAFVLLHFYDSIAALNRKYNLRFQSILTTRIFINRRNYIFHYNKKFWVDGKYVKFDPKKLSKIDTYSSDFKKIIQNNFENQKYYVDGYWETIYKNLLKDFESIL